MEYTIVSQCRRALSSVVVVILLATSSLDTVQQVSPSTNLAQVAVCILRKVGKQADVTSYFDSRIAIKA